MSTPQPINARGIHNLSYFSQLSLPTTTFFTQTHTKGPQDQQTAKEHLECLLYRPFQPSQTAQLGPHHTSTRPPQPPTVIKRQFKHQIWHLRWWTVRPGQHFTVVPGAAHIKVEVAFLGWNVSTAEPVEGKCRGWWWSVTPYSRGKCGGTF